MAPAPDPVRTCGAAFAAANLEAGRPPVKRSCVAAAVEITPTTTQYPSRVSVDQITVESPCLFEDIDDAVAACVAAQREFAKLKMSDRERIVTSIRETSMRFAEDFALCAWSETGRGRYEDKLVKQKLAIKATPGPEDLAPRCFTGDSGMTMIDYAPYGVIGAVTPVTNPTATVINNTITILSGGNGVVYNPHPAATAVTNRAIAVMNQAITKAGGPECLVASVKIPTIASGGRLLKHPNTAANLVTGGPAVVKVALESGKKSFCAGPGNPPVVVDETADIAGAAEAIYFGASFDNNMICSDEKEVFVVESKAAELVEGFRKLGAYIASPEEIEQLTTICVPDERAEWKHGMVDRFLVGQNASVLLDRIGVTADDKCRLIIAQVPASHPLIWTEQLMPILPVTKVASFNEALALALKAEYNFKHTASIYSNNLARISDMAKVMNTSIFVVNGSHYAGLASGGEGYTSFSIAGATGEGLTRPTTFVRERRLVCKDAFRFI